MNKNRKGFLFALVMMIAILISGCGAVPSKGDKISVVCTNFPIYDWVREIVGSEYADRFDVTLLAGGGDIHNYQPTAKDIVTIQTCDLLIYVGGESDIWVEEIVKQNEINSIKLFDVLEGDLICSSDNHAHDHNHADGSYDEHIWLSLKLAGKSLDAICEKIVKLSSTSTVGEGETYRMNKENYKSRLMELDEQYAAAVNGLDDRIIILADRFPFCYMTEDYGIECIAAFSGCSAEQDVSFGVIAHLAESVDAYDKETILVLENSTQSVANTVIESSKKNSVEIAVMDSCQSIGEQEIANGASYIEVMMENLEALKKALQ